MTTLAFDTSASVLSLTLLTSGGPEPGALHHVRDTGLRHVEHLATSARDLLAAAGLDVGDVALLACAAGPGSFTGLRIGMATAKGFSAARRIPFVTVPTLDIWAELYRYWPGVLVAVIDARKRRFYAAVYAGGERLTEDLDETPASILARARAAARDLEAASVSAVSSGAPAILIVGPDAEAFAAGADASDLLVAPASDTLPSHALARLARVRYEAHGPAAPDVGPSYVRRSDAESGTR
ncbi:MAG: tRNA (adenosine(37)-N6)-threonylcarbamoyltransferase complex dimerization subunit type 1 TsaB [Spirochaetaceae bacterium]